MNEAFLNWLKSAEPAAIAALSHLVAVGVEWFKVQGHVPDITPTESLDAPLRTPGADVVIKTVGLTRDEIDSILGAYATAIVKEKAIEFVKGFVMGVSVAGGGI